MFFDFFFENVMSISIFELEKYEGSIAGHITLIYYSKIIMYGVPLNLNFVQYFWLILANIFLANFEILA